MMDLVEIAYFTNDVQAMARFYQSLFRVDPVAGSEDMVIFMLDKTKLFIHKMYVPEEGGLPPENHHAFSVPDLEAACQEFNARGLTLEVPPKEYYWGFSAYLRDPDGHVIEIIEEQSEEDGVT